MINPDLRVMIGQMVMTGFCGLDASETSEIYETIKTCQPGGILLFDWDGGLKTYKRNIKSREQFQKLVAELQKATEIPLFTGIDQEGGNVCRLKEETGFCKVKSAQEIGLHNDADEAKLWSEQIAADLNYAGINLNLAPVVDLEINQDNPIIGKMGRSFGKKAEKVISLAGIFCEVIRQKGILSCLKHFPGHGSASTDTHKQFTDISDSWHESELLPFEELIKRDLPDMIMTGHLYHRKFDEHFPATLSKKIIGGILRDKLGWQGVIVSDDMQMKAITDNYSLEESIFKAINAGVDILVFGNNSLHNLKSSLTKVIDIIEKFVDEGKISSDRIVESYERIILLKQENIGY